MKLKRFLLPLLTLLVCTTPLAWAQIYDQTTGQQIMQCPTCSGVGASLSTVILRDPVSSGHQQTVDAGGGAAVQGEAASGASVSGNPVLSGGRAQNAEPTPVTNGQAVAAARDLVGKAITSPYTNKENFISGCANTTGTSGNSVIAAQGSGVKIYVTAISVANTGAANSLVTVQVDPAGTPVTLWTMMSPKANGQSVNLPVPLAVTANKAVGFTAASASTTQYVCISGYIGT